MQKLTQKTIDHAVRRRDSILAGGLPYARQLLRDHEVRGFCAIVHRESIAYSYAYKPHGAAPDGRRHNSRFIRIGDAATHSLIEAREAARDLRRRVWRGEDPKLDDARQRERDRMQHATELVAARTRITCAQRLVAYQDVLRTRGRSDKYQREELGRARLTLLEGGMADLAPAEITSALIEQALTTCSPKTRAGRFAALHRFLAWALKGTGTIPATLLFDRHEKPRKPPARQRVLASAELTALWRAAEQLASPVATNLVRFLLTVPCRRGEATAMRWCDVDLTAAVWHQPTSKNTDPHDFPLNRGALAILNQQYTATGGTPAGLVFPGPRPTRPFDSWNHVFRMLRAATPDISDIRLHDLRRTFCTTLAEAGTDEILLDLIINHRASRSRSGVRGVYQRAERWSERVAALAAWNDHLDRALGTNVAPLRRQRTG